MITIPIYEPLWRCRHGIFEQYGEGNLTPEIWPKHETIESFSVKSAGGELSVYPSLGEVRFDGSTVLKTAPGKLIWQREMSFDFSTQDNNSRSAPRMEFYRIGIENTSGRHGFRVYESGKVVLGL
jgi:hypothetical protein